MDCCEAVPRVDCSTNLRFGNSVSGRDKHCPSPVSAATRFGGGWPFGTLEAFRGVFSFRFAVGYCVCFSGHFCLSVGSPLYLSPSPGSSALLCCVGSRTLHTWASKYYAGTQEHTPICMDGATLMHWLACCHRRVGVPDREPQG